MQNEASSKHSYPTSKRRKLNIKRHEWDAVISIHSLICKSRRASASSIMIGLLFSGVSGLCQVAGLVGNVAGVVSNVATVTSALGTVGQVASAIDSVTGNPAFEHGVEIGEKAAHAAAHYAKTKKHKSPEKKRYGSTERPVNREHKSPEKKRYGSTERPVSREHKSPEKKRYDCTERPVNRSEFKDDDDDGDDYKLTRYREKLRESGLVCGILYGGAAKGAGAGAFGYSADEYKAYYHKM